MDPNLKAYLLLTRAQSIANQFQQGGSRNHIDEAIALDRKALELCSPGNYMRAPSLTRLAIHLSDRYNQFGDVRDIEEEVGLVRAALELRPPGHAERDQSLNRLGVCLHARYRRLGAVEDLDEAIIIGRETLALHPPGHSDRSASLCNVSLYLNSRYEKLGATGDLDEAIALVRDALSLCPPGNPRRSMLLNNLAMYLEARYQKLGAAEDLDQAIALARDSLVLRPLGHPDRSMSLSNLAMYLDARYQKLGAVMDLDEAIAFGRDALALRLGGHPLRSMSLNNLAAHLNARYQRLGAVEDLDEAVALARDSLALRPLGHPDRSNALNNLAMFLNIRYRKLGAAVDLDEAIALGRDALVLYPLGHPQRSTSLSNLAGYLDLRHQRLGAVESLDEAITLCQDSLLLRPPGHPHRLSSLNNLAKYLNARYHKLGTVADLNKAIALSRDALALCPIGHHSRSNLLWGLAWHLRSLFEHSGQSKDKEEMFNVYAEIAHIDSSQMVSLDDLSGASAWIRAAETFRHPSVILAYETFLQLLVHYLVTLPSLPRHLKIVKDHMSSIAMDAFAACLRQGTLTRAIELLEQGRGVFFGQLTRLRSPADDIMALGPEGRALGEKFTRITSNIRNALQVAGADQHDRVWRVNVELQGVVSDIRKLSGFSHFLLPPPFSDLRKAAIDGPVIIVNACKYSCDALVIPFDRDPVHIPLRVTKDDVRDMTLELQRWVHRAKFADVGKHFVGVLRELWDNVVSPIVDVLQTVHPSRSRMMRRIWWCPTAEFSLLPLHAAGVYRKNQPKFSDLYISSYTSSLTALIRARRLESSRHSTHQTVRRFVAIGQAQATGESELHAIGDELINIGKRVAEHTSFSCMEGPTSNISRVVEALGKNECVHLACHGLPNQEHPFESAFGLYDGRLTIERITQLELENPEFAYLSACHTTVGDKECPDEMIHLASAMQFVGFRSVIGTMWAVNDVEAKRMASMFYDNWVGQSGCLDYTRVAFALHKTVNKAAGVPFDQRILYVHMGA